MSPSASSQTVILGAGLIGVSTAYHLSLSSSSTPIHLVDPAPTLFTSASGFAGGLLVRTWFPAPLASLGSLSYALHTQLAEEQGGREKWGWSRVAGVSFVEDEESVDGKRERGGREEGEVGRLAGGRG